MIRLALVAAVGVLAATPAHAMECWQVTGWSTSAPRMWTKPSTATERAVVVPVDCDVTPSGYRWLNVTAEYASGDPAPADLYVLAPHEDATRMSWTGDDYALTDGLTWQSRYAGILPVMWRDVSAPDLVSELDAPAPVAPAVGAIVVLRQRDSGDCVSNGDYDPQSPHLWISDYDCQGANPLTSQNDYAYEIVDAGTNGAGQPLVWLEHVSFGTCASVEDWYGTDMVLHDDCVTAASGFDMRLVPVSGGGYRIRNEDTGLCYGGAFNPATYNHWLVSTACTASGSIYDLVTLQRAPSGGGGEVPPEDM